MDGQTFHQMLETLGATFNRTDEPEPDFGPPPDCEVTQVTEPPPIPQDAQWAVRVSRVGVQLDQWTPPHLPYGSQFIRWLDPQGRVPHLHWRVTVTAEDDDGYDAGPIAEGFLDGVDREAWNEWHIGRFVAAQTGKYAMKPESLSIPSDAIAEQVKTPAKHVVTVLEGPDEVRRSIHELYGDDVVLWCDDLDRVGTVIGRISDW